MLSSSVSGLPPLVVLLEEEKKVCGYCKVLSLDFNVEQESDCFQKIDDYLKTRADIFSPPYIYYITEAKDRRFDRRIHVSIRHQDNHPDCRIYDIQIERKICAINFFQEPEIVENLDEICVT